jgi:hypothetical protein
MDGGDGAGVESVGEGERGERAGDGDGGARRWPAAKWAGGGLETT